MTSRELQKEGEFKRMDLSDEANDEDPEITFNLTMVAIVVCDSQLNDERKQVSMVDQQNEDTERSR